MAVRLHNKLGLNSVFRQRFGGPGETIFGGVEASPVLLNPGVTFYAARREMQVSPHTRQGFSPARLHGPPERSSLSKEIGI